MPDEDEQPAMVSIAPAVVLIDREGEGAMRRAARFARKVPEAWNALHDSERIRDLQGELIALLDTIERDLLCFYAEGRKAPADPLPCSLERWQGNLRDFAKGDYVREVYDRPYVRQIRNRALRNAQDFRAEVQLINRAARTLIVDTERRGSYAISGHGKEYD